MPKFTSNTGAPVQVYINGVPAFYVDPDIPYETENKDAIAALRASPSVDEVKSARQSESKKKRG